MGTFTLFILSILAAGNVLGASGQATESTGEARVELAGTPALKIVGATDEGITLTRSGPAFHQTFLIESTSRAEVKGLQIIFQSFASPEGDQVTTSWRVENLRPGEQVVVPPLGSITVVVDATFARSGTYTSFMTLVYGDKRETTKITVLRAHRKIPAEVSSVPASTAEGLWDDPSISATVHETDGSDLTLSPPAITELALVDVQKVKLDADRFRVVLTDDEGRTLPDPFVLKGGVTKRFTLAIQGLKSAGQYEGVLRVTAPNAEPIDKPFTLYVKRSWVAAGALIMLGVAASFFLRRYARTVRPHLDKQRRLLALRDEVNALAARAGDLSPDEHEVVESFNDRIAKLYGAEPGDDVAQADVDKTVEEITAKLPLIPKWIKARLLLDSVNLPGGEAGLREQLATVKRYLLEAGAPGGEEAEAARTTLNGFAATVNTALKADLSAKLDELAAEAEKFQNEPATPIPVFESLQKNVIDKIIAARRALVGDSLNEAAGLYNGARGEYARARIAGLRHMLATKRPRGITEAEWEAITKGVKDKLAAGEQASDPDQVIAAYYDAFTLYVRLLKEELEKQIAVLHEALSDDHLKAKAAEYGAMLDAASARLDSSVKEAVRRRTAEAVKQFEEAVKLVREVDAFVSSGGGLLEAEVGAMGMPATPPTSDIPGRAAGVALFGVANLAPPPGGAAGLKSKMERYDLIFQLVLGLIVVILGLNLLWVDNPMWGGWKDIITALLWGLGLHHVAGAGLEGLPLESVAQKFSGQEK